MPSHPSSKNNDINKAKKTETGTIIVIGQSNLALDGDIIPITAANKKSEANTINSNISVLSIKVASKKRIVKITKGEM